MVAALYKVLYFTLDGGGVGGGEQGGVGDTAATAAATAAGDGSGVLHGGAYGQGVLTNEKKYKRGPNYGA